MGRDKRKSFSLSNILISSFLVVVGWGGISESEKAWQVTHLSKEVLDERQAQEARVLDRFRLMREQRADVVCMAQRKGRVVYAFGAVGHQCKLDRTRCRQRIGSASQMVDAIHVGETVKQLKCLGLHPDDKKRTWEGKYIRSCAVYVRPQDMSVMHKHNNMLPHLQSHLSFTARGSGCMRAMAVVRGFSFRRVCTLSIKATSLVNCSLVMPCTLEAASAEETTFTIRAATPITHLYRHTMWASPPHSLSTHKIAKRSPKIPHKTPATRPACPTYIGVGPGGVVTGSRRELLENMFHHAHLGACQVRDLAQVMVHHEGHPPLHQHLDHGNLSHFEDWCVRVCGPDERLLIHILYLFSLRFQQDPT